MKALPALDGTALYFSRAPVPWPRDHVAGGRPAGFAGAWRHIGIYAYRVRSLLKFSAWPPTPLEEAEKLEQLRALEHGMRIHLVALSEPPPAGVGYAGGPGTGCAPCSPGGRIVDVGHGAVLMPTARPSKEMSVLFVCLGNICRSPTAEGVLRHLLGPAGAGTAGRGRFGRNRRLSHRRTSRCAHPARRPAARNRLECAARPSGRARGFRALRLHSGHGSQQFARASGPAARGLARRCPLVHGVRAGTRAAGGARSLLRGRRRLRGGVGPLRRGVPGFDRRPTEMA